MTATPTWNTTVHVPAFDADFTQTWKPAGVCQQLTQIAMQHAGALGYDYRDMLAAGRTWVLSRLKLRFFDTPHIGETLSVTTWPKGLQQKLFFLRDFEVHDEEHTLRIAGTSAWLLMDTHARRLLTPQALGGALPDNDGRFALDEPLEKLNPPELPERFIVTARYSCIDLMGHVNNARYLEWISDCFDLDEYRQRPMAGLQINYLNEVRPGARVAVCAGPANGDAAHWLVYGVNLESGLRAFEAAVSWN